MFEKTWIIRGVQVLGFLYILALISWPQSPWNLFFQSAGVFELVSQQVAYMYAEYGWWSGVSHQWYAGWPVVHILFPLLSFIAYFFAVLTPFTNVVGWLSAQVSLFYFVIVVLLYWLGQSLLDVKFSQPVLRKELPIPEFSFELWMGVLKVIYAGFVVISFLLVPLFVDSFQALIVRFPLFDVFNFQLSAELLYVTTLLGFVFLFLAMITSLYAILFYDFVYFALALFFGVMTMLTDQLAMMGIVLWWVSLMIASLVRVPRPYKGKNVMTCMVLLLVSSLCLMWWYDWSFWSLLFNQYVGYALNLENLFPWWALLILGGLVLIGLVIEIMPVDIIALVLFVWMILAALVGVHWFFILGLGLFVGYLIFNWLYVLHYKSYSLSRLSRYVVQIMQWAVLLTVLIMTLGSILLAQNTAFLHISSQISRYSEEAWVMATAKAHEVFETQGEVERVMVLNDEVGVYWNLVGTIPQLTGPDDGVVFPPMFEELHEYVESGGDLTAKWMAVWETDGLLVLQGDDEDLPWEGFELSDEKVETPNGVFLSSFLLQESVSISRVVEIRSLPDLQSIYNFEQVEELNAYYDWTREHDEVMIDVSEQGNDMVFKLNLERTQGVRVALLHDGGWKAVQRLIDGRLEPVEILEDPLGMMVLKPLTPGRVVLELRHEATESQHRGVLLTWLGLGIAGLWMFVLHGWKRYLGR